MALGAVDGSTALGFAMQVHVVGALVRFARRSRPLSAIGVFRAIVEDGALVNNAATEEGGGSPARGAIPGTTAAPKPTARGGSPGRRPGPRGCRT